MKSKGLMGAAAAAMLALGGLGTGAGAAMAPAHAEGAEPYARRAARSPADVVSRRRDEQADEPPERPHAREGERAAPPADGARRGEALSPEPHRRLSGPARINLTCAYS